jgi:hypothetical protein
MSQTAYIDPDPANEAEHAKSWIFGDDGLEVSGAYVSMETGSSAFGRTPVIVLAVDGARRSVWLNTALLRAKFRDELERRRARDFHVGERIVIRRGAEKKTSSADRQYWPFRVEFPDGPQQDAAAILGACGEVDDQPAEDDIPF